MFFEKFRDESFKNCGLCPSHYLREPALSWPYVPIGNVKKLVPNFFDKEKYVIHYENLQLYLRLGLKLNKIHCVLELNQSQWLKLYVELNTQNRIKAEKNSDKDGKALYKLMNNAVYGKIMENLRNRIDVKIASNKIRLYEMDIYTQLYVIQNI